ncbi:hypothetical protein, partial [Escherichia coli]|uniref:hypothetical protein n=1 Tax=Escherichia coli TaxID=562 RepID=UPI00207B5B53
MTLTHFKGLPTWPASRKQKLSLRKAAERLKAELGDNPAVVPLVTKDEPEIFAEDEAGRQQLLSRVVAFYHHTLLNAPEAVAY